MFKEAGKQNASHDRKQEKLRKVTVNRNNSVTEIAFDVHVLRTTQERDTVVYGHTENSVIIISSKKESFLTSSLLHHSLTRRVHACSVKRYPGKQKHDELSNNCEDDVRYKQGG